MGIVRPIRDANNSDDYPADERFPGEESNLSDGQEILPVDQAGDSSVGLLGSNARYQGSFEAR